MLPIRLFDARVDEAGLRSVDAVLQSGALASGAEVALFEREIGAWLGVENVVVMSDATHAAELALRLSGVQRGDHVMTLSFNCLSSNAAITSAGAVPVWVDVEPGTARISVGDVERAVTEKTRALVVYHVAGYPADMGSLLQLCADRGIALIEDANAALGATVQEGRIGCLGKFGVFSFYANRQVNAIEGAALVCPDGASAERARRLRRFGIDYSVFRDADGEINPRADIGDIGISAPMLNVNAALGRLSLSSLEERLLRTRSNADYLRSSLAHLRGLEVLSWAPNVRPSFWALLVRSAHRDNLLRRLKASGIQCSKLHQPNHVYSGFHAETRNLPGTDLLSQEVMAIPCGWWLEKDQLDLIVDSMANVTN
jgi:dTDP-4-amino-4,6-dideoxygalactose transaminase